MEAAGGLIGRQVDHLFARLPTGGRLAYTVADDAYGSDHRPLIGTAAGATRE